MRLEPDSCLLTLLILHYEHSIKEPPRRELTAGMSVDDKEWLAELYSEEHVEDARRCDECRPYADKHTAALDAEIEALSNGLEFLFDDELRDQIAKGIVKLRCSPMTLLERREIMRDTLRTLNLLSEQQIAEVVERRLPA